jgi:hypothetical protein
MQIADIFADNSQWDFHNALVRRELKIRRIQTLNQRVLGSSPRGGTQKSLVFTGLFAFLEGVILGVSV